MNTALWVILAVLFLLLAIWHFIQAPKTIRSMVMTQRPGSGKIVAQGLDLDQPLSDFVAEFNSYLAEYNRSNTRLHRFAGMGYLLASAASAASFILSS